VKLPTPLLAGKFVNRLNRFAILVKLRDGQVVTAHLPNSGRLHEVLKVGNKFWLAHKLSPNRRTKFDAILAKDGNALVSVDARLPPKLLLEGIEAGIVSQFGEIVVAKSEVPFGSHRLDLQLVTSSSHVWWVETKSVTLVLDGVALFPDAPTVRGREHLHLLGKLAQKGELAAVVFVVQREDAEVFAPNESADPEFARILREVAYEGVRVFAYSCKVTFTHLQISHQIPVWLD